MRRWLPQDARDWLLIAVALFSLTALLSSAGCWAIVIHVLSAR